MQNLKFYQSLWAMEQRIPNKPELPIRENFQKISRAGFDGVCLDLGIHELDEFRKTKALFEEFNLDCMVNVFPSKPEHLLPMLEFSKDLNACMVNVISGVMPIQPQDAVTNVTQWMQEADDLNIPLLFETHRDSLLNDLYFTLQLIDLIPEMRLCADLSHFVVDRELRLPLVERDRKFIHKILERSDCFQGRVANREQIQIAIDFPQHQEWVDQFQDWWREGITLWRERNHDQAELVFLCELGPRPYAITDKNQEELSNRWEEALKIRVYIEDVWSEIDKDEKKNK